MDDKKQTVFVEAVGPRKGLGKVKFLKHPTYRGDVAELDKEVADRLLESDGQRDKPLFALAQEKQKPGRKPTV